MNHFYRIGLWNANGLAKHCQDLKLFISYNKLDIVLISETHFTNLSYFKIPDFTTYITNHPDNTAHGGTAIIIKTSIKHFENPKYQLEFLQGTSVTVEDWQGPLTLSSVYCPPRHNITSNQFNDFFNTLGHRFLSGGDYNAKHQMWGSRINNPRGRQLARAMLDNNLNPISTAEPTYWPTDLNKLPDLLDFLWLKVYQTTVCKLNQISTSRLTILLLF
jgi:hypothetical protein